MRILVAGPETGDYFTHNIIHSFRRMGHETLGVSMKGSVITRTAIGRGAEFLLEKASNGWRARLERGTINAAKDFKPHLIVAGTRTLEPNTVDELRRVNQAKVVCWYADPPANLKRDHIVSGEYDAVFLKDMAFAHRLRKILGIKAYHLDEACNPDWHKPVANRKSNEIVIAGSLYGYRGRIAERLADSGHEVKVYGPRPSAWVKEKISSLHTGSYLDHLNKAEIFGQAMACLNTFTPGEGDSLNCRVFETCGCGALLLSEKRDAIGRCFDAGVEYLSFESFEESLDLLDRLRGDYSFGSAIREQAVKRAHGQHSYQHRLAKILETMDMV
jgi:spore maturation protein CgeB